MSILTDLGGPKAIVSGVMGGLSGLFPQTTTTNTNTDQNTSGETNSNHNEFSNQTFQTWLEQLMSAYNEQNTSGISSTTPNLSPENAAFLSKLMASYGGLGKPVDLSGYEAGQIQGINQNSDLAKQSADAIMASRGLSTSPVAATTDANIDNQRFSQINQMQGQLPLLKNQLNLNNLGAAANFMNLIPHGTTTTNVGTTSGTSGSSTNTKGDQTATSASGGTGYSGNSAATHSNSTQKSRPSGGLPGLLAGLFG